MGSRWSAGRPTELKRRPRALAPVGTEMVVPVETTLAPRRTSGLVTKVMQMALRCSLKELISSKTSGCPSMVMTSRKFGRESPWKATSTISPRILTM
jgi:hypothetical protein